MNNLHTYIQPQLDSMIDELIFKGYTLEGLSTPLTHIDDWYDMSPYDKVMIDCDGMKGTFKQLLFMAELMTDEYKLPNYSLIMQVSCTIESRWEIQQRLEQEDYMANYIPVLEVAV